MNPQDKIAQKELNTLTAEQDAAHNAKINTREKCFDRVLLLVALLPAAFEPINDLLPDELNWIISMEAEPKTDGIPRYHGSAQAPFELLGLSLRLHIDLTVFLDYKPSSYNDPHAGIQALYSIPELNIEPSYAPIDRDPFIFALQEKLQESKEAEPPF